MAKSDWHIFGERCAKRCDIPLISSPYSRAFGLGLDQPRRYRPPLSSRLPRRQSRRDRQVHCRRSTESYVALISAPPLVTPIILSATVKAYGELPEHAKINETDTFGEEDGECTFEFGDDDEVDIDDI